LPEQRFSPKALNQLHDTFKKLQKQVTMDESDEKGNILKKTVPVIFKQEFREQMGILG
jgi:hypothetical protein